MILFLGVRPGKSEIIQLQGVSCPHCGNTQTMALHNTPHYFHLFWIKILTVYTSRLVECSHCKRVYYKEEFTEEMKQALP